jgi:putative transposase
LDGIVFKVRKDARVINKCVYSVLGVNLEGRKEILGIWISENESASFWLSVCNELKNRGVQDILIACRNNNNLSGFSEAIATAFPQTEQQLCVIHQIRNSTKYVSYKDIKEVMAGLARRHWMMPNTDSKNSGKLGARNTRKSLNPGIQTGRSFPRISSIRRKYAD